MRWKYRKKLNDFMTAVADDSEGEIWLYGDIVDEAENEIEASPTSVENYLRDIGKVKTLNLRVNSYGGSVPAGNAIINILDDYRYKTGCRIDAYILGIAASMSSGIPMVADKIYMAENAMYMLHKPWSIAAGNSHDIEKTVEKLEKAEDTLVVNYMRKFNGTEDELRQMLADETWLTAYEALKWGLCDEIIPAVPVAASLNGIRINNREFVVNAGKIAARFTPNTPYAKVNQDKNSVAILKPYNKREANPQMYEYDETLASFGITEEMFQKLNVDSSDAIAICKAFSAIITPQEASKPYITVDMVKDTLGKELPPERVLELAKSAMEIDPKSAEKVKAYDKMVSNAIENAIKSGIKAKGENFNESKWKKILSSLDYDEILDQSNEWEQEAKDILNAGKRVSQPWKPTETDNGNVNPDNYNFC